MRESLVWSQQSSRHQPWKPLPCLFSEEHIQSLSLMHCGWKHHLLTTVHPLLLRATLMRAKADGKVVSVPLHPGNYLVTW